MTNIRKPLKKSILIGMAVFTVVLCVCLVTVQYLSIRRFTYRHYEEHINHVLDYAESQIDPDDLAECIRSGQKSEQFAKTQNALDVLKAIGDIHYIYIVIPLNRNATDNMQNVMAGVSKEEAETMADQLVQLNQLTGTDYSPEIAGLYLDAWQAGKPTFFENRTVFGNNYTGLRTIVDSRGEKVAALCVDISIEEIDRHLRESILDILIVVIIIALLFAAVFVAWSNRKIVTPIRQLEESMASLAEKSQGQQDPEALLFTPPEIHTGNEVESLSLAIQKTNRDMVTSMKELLRQAQEASHAGNQGNRDSLTRVGTEKAWEMYLDGFRLRMAEGLQEFAVVLVDTRGLRNINEQYGWEKGDLYLQKACRILCEVFRHSPVFRIGGDRFITVLTGGDYDSRTLLLNRMRINYQDSQANPGAAPWEKVRVTMVSADRQPKEDRSLEAVYDRAVRLLQAEKAKEEQK